MYRVKYLMQKKHKKKTKNQKTETLYLNKYSNYICESICIVTFCQCGKVFGIRLDSGQDPTNVLPSFYSIDNRVVHVFDYLFLVNETSAKLSYKKFHTIYVRTPVFLWPSLQKRTKNILCAKFSAISLRCTINILSKWFSVRASVWPFHWMLSIYILFVVQVNGILC